MLKVLYDEESIRRRLDELAAGITRAYEGREITAVIVMNGAIFFAADLLRRIERPVCVDAVAAGSYVHHASSGKLTIRSTPKLKMAGRHVLLLDDILDTGLTLRELKRLALEAGAASVRTCVLIDKLIPASEKMTSADWYGFQSPPAYLVGCGMDSDERFRTLRDICIYSESAESGQS